MKSGVVGEFRSRYKCYVKYFSVLVNMSLVTANVNNEGSLFKLISLQIILLYKSLKEKGLSSRVNVYIDSHHFSIACTVFWVICSHILIIVVQSVNFFFFLVMMELIHDSSSGEDQHFHFVSWLFLTFVIVLEYSCPILFPLLLEQIFGPH
jgi:hypothetical protein